MRFQFSIRSLFIVTLVAAVASLIGTKAPETLVPFVFMLAVCGALWLLIAAVAE